MKLPELRPSVLLPQKFPHTPTQGQLVLFEKMDYFFFNDELGPQSFVLKGYAGTGKTTLVAAIIKILARINYKFVLLAPTGRAAKVMAFYTKKKALTIHKKIYKQTSDTYTGNLTFVRQKNNHSDTLFIIDESSMISDDSEYGTNGLLTDLIEYVYGNEDGENKLLFIGDTAQLPPVGQIVSPALDAEYLRNQFAMTVFEHELTEVMRQDAHSGILFNATHLRSSIAMPVPQIQMTNKGFNDFYRMSSDRLEDGLRYAYKKYGQENAIVLCRSNKTAVAYNRYIRQQINFAEEELQTGDFLMIVRNNYTCLGEESVAGFIANGDFAEVTKIIRREEQHGFRFATLRLRLTDYPEQEEFEANVILNTLYSDSAQLTRDESKALYNSVVQEYEHIKNRKERAEAIRKDSYLNALQVKFAYALTCHKSQGGQWSAVFIDQGYLREELINPDFLRWLYTAITRATHEVFLINFHARFFA